MCSLGCFLWDSVLSRNALLFGVPKPLWLKDVNTPMATRQPSACFVAIIHFVWFISLSWGAAPLTNGENHKFSTQWYFLNEPLYTVKNTALHYVCDVQLWEQPDLKLEDWITWISCEQKSKLLLCISTCLHYAPLCWKLSLWDNYVCQSPKHQTCQLIVETACWLRVLWLALMCELFDMHNVW